MIDRYNIVPVQRDGCRIDALDPGTDLSEIIPLGQTHTNDRTR
jgi:hypothetical protein